MGLRQASYGVYHATMSFDGKQCRMVRAALDLSNVQLATLAGVAPNTVSRFELGQDVRLSNANAIRAVLEARGAVFVGAGQVAPIDCVGINPL